VLESLFQFLFKYRPVVFERGTFVFDPPWPPLAVVIAGIVTAAVAGALYVRTRSRLDRRDRVVLSLLRLGAVSVLVFCLLHPMLVVATVVPQANFLGILLDDSRSMQVTDRGDRARSAVMTEAFGSTDAPIVSALTERFKLRFFRFSDVARRLNDTTELTFDGRRTDLGRALDGARRELGGVPLAGLVVVTDGAENGAQGSLSQSVLQLQAAGVPVYAVGMGAERFERDIALRRATAPRRVLAGSSVAVDVTVGQSGFGGSQAELIVEDAEQILASRAFDLPRDGDVTTVRMHFTAEEPGPRRLRFRIAARDGEAVVTNNELERLVVVEDARPRILYFEGEPRFEVKFLRRAVTEDDNVRLVVLQRTANEKFYAIDVDEEDDLSTGFPATREELFRYDGLILGSVEASFFTHDQLSMIAEFVGRRGGGLLVLGGRRSFAEGGYANTPLAEALPVALDPARRGASRGARSRTDRRRNGYRREDSGASDSVWPHPPRHSARGCRRGFGAALAIAAGTHHRESAHGAQACRERAPRGRRRGLRRSHCRACLPAIRARQSAGPSGAGYVALADARRHVPRGRDPRDLLASGPALARSRRARARHTHRWGRPRRDGIAGGARG
jgi:hypothetical protein